MENDISLDTIVTETRYLEGIRIKSCLNSGFCCTKVPCEYGERNETNGACKYLTEPNSIGQMFCGRYDWIMENVPGAEWYPGFGAGCCMPMFNEMRDEVFKKLPKHIQEKLIS